MKIHEKLAEEGWDLIQRVLITGSDPKVSVCQFKNSLKEADSKIGVYFSPYKNIYELCWQEQ